MLLLKTFYIGSIYVFMYEFHHCLCILHHPHVIASYIYNDAIMMQLHIFKYMSALAVRSVKLARWWNNCKNGVPIIRFNY